MDAPEYLDLDEIDFTDDLVYSVTSLKSIPELCRRNESQSEDRQVPAINWSRGVSSHGGNGIKPAGIADVHSKFRPVKRVSPLKHQPEVPDSGADAKSQSQNGDGSKEEASDKPSRAGEPSAEGRGFKGKGGGGGGGGPLFGELEHYDLDMDEILDVPYIKSSQQVATLPRAAARTRGGGAGGGPGERGMGGKASGPPHHGESLGGVMPYCALSPVKWPDIRKSKSMDPDFLRQPPLGLELSQGPRGCPPPSADAEPPARAFPEPRPHKALGDIPGSQSMNFPLQGCSSARADGGRSWGGSRAHGEVDEEAKKVQNIINTIRGGQISLLPHLAADNLELIRDEDGNNLLHISASEGHADCLQHLTSLMGEDCLNERNSEQLTPAGLGIKNGHLECVRWMVSETEAIAELSCSREHPSLIHYAARYGQEKILLWLLQFMQEQAISLDEVDQSGNSAVHVAAQHGHLGCIQTLVEYGSNVTIQNQHGERPSQSAERHGHTTCSRYLVVVETCMSLASQVVKLTKQLNEQTAAKVTLQNQVQQLLLDSPRGDGSSSPTASGHAAHMEAWPEMTLTAEAGPGDGHWVLRQRDVDSDTVLRQLLGKEISEKVCTSERLSLEFRGAEAPAGADPGVALRRMGVVERRELKLARLKQIMQRSLSESDTDSYPPEERHAHGSAPGPAHSHSSAHGPAPGPAPGPARPDRPRQLAVGEGDEPAASLHLVMKRHAPSSAERKLAFAHGSSKSADGYNPSPTSDCSDPDHEPRADAAAAAGGDGGPDGGGGGSQKNATSPKSALKSPSSRRKTSQSLKLRVTFDEPVVHKEAPEGEARGGPAKEGERGAARTSAGGEPGEAWKRPFGTFRSIMESLSGNQNSNNNNPHGSPAAKCPASTPKCPASTPKCPASTTKCPGPAASLSSPARKTSETRANQTSVAKSKSKTSAV
ncbi:LOW QUALITY PROTEIN: synphilin-1 [Anguilla anguilla]|uniref:LOW QUALITY PROTEIN: synphilin-1 n=1 Tax=Anguilla anguilla TaxID=7936 RepID=UPI0015A7C51F|nr:LOW QUALITY PROTEIN: synphilin-1 [Anguilla anguilla]